MSRELVRKLEDPLHPLLGPNLRGLAFFGLWRPQWKTHHYLYDIISALCIFFVGTQYVQVFFLWGDLGAVLDNLWVTTVSTMAVLKLATFRIWHNRWNQILRAVSAIEICQKENQRSEDMNVTKSYILHGHIVTYFFWTVIYLTITMIMLNPLLIYASHGTNLNETAQYPHIFSSWLPFDVSEPPKYYFNVSLHIIMGYFGAGTLAVWDTCMVSLMVFFKAQLQLLRNNCSRIMGAPDEPYVVDEEVHRRIARCHRHHIFLLKYSKMLNSVISPVMFVYFIICSVMLSAIALLLTTQVTGALQLFWTLEFLAACLIQLFMFYWYSNRVLYESMTVVGGVYEASWVGRDRRLVRDLALLAMGLRLPIVFSAGPFNDMTITTFNAILKGAYSYFTLLRARQQMSS